MEEEGKFGNMPPYNTESKKLRLPEYGRGVQKMVAKVMAIEDREKRTEQAYATVKVMELLNPQVHLQDDWEHKLWDHLFIISDFKLDVDAPYPMPAPEQLDTRPEIVPVQKKPLKAAHYGRNIESIIDLIAGMEDGPTKEYVIRNLASYMRTQYLIWNKDTVADETIFADIEKLSNGRVKVPEGLSLSKISSDASYSRPGMNQGRKQNQGGGRHGRKNNQFKK